MGKLKTVKGYYYKIFKTSPSYESVCMDANELVNLMESIHKTQYVDRSITVSGSSRMILLNSEAPRGLDFPEYPDYILGIFTNRREGYDYPYLASVDSDNSRMIFREIQKGDNEIFSEMTFFMISKKTGTILMIPTRFAGTDKILETYFNSFIRNHNLEIPCKDETATMISLAPVISEDVYKKADRLTKVSTFKFACAYPNKKDIKPEDVLENRLPLLEESFQSLTMFDGMNLELKSKVRKVPKNGVINFIRNLFSQNKDIRYLVTTCKITGEDAYGASIVDFIKDNYLTILHVPVEEGKKTYSRKELVERMHEDFIIRDKTFNSAVIV